MIKTKTIATIFILVILFLLRCNIASNQNKSNQKIDKMNKLDCPLEEILNKTNLVNFDPVFTCEIANDLILLGKPRALEEIKTLNAENEKGLDNFGFFLLLRVIFEVPAKMSYPDIQIGKFDFEKPSGEKTTNQFPILFSNGLPFLIITGYNATGLPQPLEDHIQFYKEHGILKNGLFDVHSKYTENELLDNLQIEWSKIYNIDKMPDNLKTSIQRQIKRAIKTAANKG